MATRWQLTVVAMCTLLVTPSAHADIYRWDTGEVIPGTEGIEAGPGVDLSSYDFHDGPWNSHEQNLRHADFSGGLNLSGSDFSWSWLDNADFSGANLTHADLGFSTLTNADLTGTVVTKARFDGTTSGGFTEEQLYSTASYQQKNLQGIVLGNGNDLSGWDFSGQDLTGASFNDLDWPANLTGANLSGANLTQAKLGDCILADADLTDAIVTGALLNLTTSGGFTKEQLYPTASYQEKKLQGIFLYGNDLTGWDFSGQDLSNAVLPAAMTNADLTGAVIAGAFMHGSFTKEQLYSTASYQNGNLQGIVLGIGSGWDLNEQDLTGARLSMGTETVLTSANLKNALLVGAEGAVFDAATVYNQWTHFSGGLDPVVAGLTLEISPEGDFNANDILGGADVDLLADRIREFSRKFNPTKDAMFDLNDDSKVDMEDHHVWVKDIKNTWFGDANLDGEFNSSDMVHVFTAGKYEKGWYGHRLETLMVHNGAGWSQGDWNGDGIFDSSDMVTAFADGGYEQGPRMDATAVPEPSAWLLTILTTSILFSARRFLTMYRVPC